MRTKADIDYMLNFTYTKSSSSIIAKAVEKVRAIEAKIAERERNIEKLRKEFDISDTMMMELLTVARQQLANNHVMKTYLLNKTSSDGRMTDETIAVGAGVVNVLFTEQDSIEVERAQIHKLRLVIRNLEDVPDDEGIMVGHKLTNQEIEYLGF